MLHDTLNPDEIVDSEAALEFMKEATKLASTTELEDIGERLEHKNHVFAELLSEERLDVLTEIELKQLLGWVFSLRRKTSRLLQHNSLQTIRTELKALLHGDDAVPTRFDRFLDSVGGLDRAMIVSLASEALHFSDPRRYWLWTHWVWNPGNGTGALALVTQDGVDLSAATDGAVYHKVGQATALVNARGHAEGFARVGRGLFGTDVFLACVYSVYMYTVFRVKLSQEFNRILPELPDLVQRVLGVHQMGEVHGR